MSAFKVPKDAPKIVHYLLNEFRFKYWCHEKFDSKDWTESDNGRLSSCYTIDLEWDYKNEYLLYSALIYIYMLKDLSGFRLSFRGNWAFQNIARTCEFKFDDTGNFDHNAINEFVEKRLIVNQPISVFKELKK